MAGDEKQKIVVNGATTAWNPTFQDNITMALLQNGSIKRIQGVFQQRLDEVGWTQSLREHVEQLFRSGEVTTYDDTMKLVTRQVTLQTQAEENAAARNGAKGGNASSTLTIPREVAKDAADVVKKEISKIVKVEK